MVVVVLWPISQARPYQIGELPYGYDGISTAVLGRQTDGLSFKEALVPDKYG